MKILKVIILFIACLTLNSFSADKIKNDLTLNNKKGSIKSVKYKVFFGISKFGEFQKQGIEKVVAVQYNEKGFIIGLNKYTSDGNLSAKSISKYDSKGNLNEENEYNSEGGLMQRFIYNYDTKGNQNEICKYLSNGNLSAKSISRFDYQCHKIEENLYKSDGILSAKSTYRFDAKGNQIEKCGFVLSENNWSTKWTYKYDSKGNKIEENMYTPNGDLIVKSIYKYYANGNPFEEYHNGVFDNSKTTYTYDYDKVGNWIKKNTFTEDIQTGYIESEIEYY